MESYESSTYADVKSEKKLCFHRGECLLYGQYNTANDSA